MVPRRSTRLPDSSLDALVQIGGECVVWLPLNESHAELGLKPQIGVRIRVNGPRSFKRRRSEVGSIAWPSASKGPCPTLSLDGEEKEMPPWPDAENGVVLPFGWQITVTRRRSVSRFRWATPWVLCRSRHQYWTAATSRRRLSTC